MKFPRIRTSQVASNDNTFVLNEFIYYTMTWLRDYYSVGYFYSFFTRRFHIKIKYFIWYSLYIDKRGYDMYSYFSKHRKQKLISFAM